MAEADRSPEKEKKMNDASYRRWKSWLIRSPRLRAVNVNRNHTQLLHGRDGEQQFLSVTGPARLRM